MTSTSPHLPAGRPVRSTDPVADLAEAVADSARAVPGVLGLHAGPYGEVAVHAAGRRIDGVRLRPGLLEVHLVLRADTDLVAVADRVREVVGDDLRTWRTSQPGPSSDDVLADGFAEVVVEVVVEDIRTPAAGT